MGLCRVIFAAGLLAAIALLGLALTTQSHAQELTQSHARKDADKGPRALGLVQITDQGKARMIPIAIMMDGKFYDAESYKATPVPMALDFGIVYEGFRAGVSQGLFTITQPGQLNHEWIAEGTWLPEGAKPKTDKQKYAAPVIDEGGGNDDRPVLHRRAGGEGDKDADKNKDEAKPAGASTTGNSTTGTSSAPPSSSPSPSTTPGTTPSTSGSTSSSASSSTSSSTSSPSPSSSTGSSPSTGAKTSDTAKAPDSAGGKPSDSSSAKASDSSAGRKSDYDQPISDPNRPILRRGKPDSNAHHEPFVNFDDPAQAAAASNQAGKEAAAAKASAGASGLAVVAISDAGGPDPRPYTYDLKPAEEAIYRNKMLELAAQQLRPRTQQNGSPRLPADGGNVARKKSSSAKASSSKTSKPEFEGITLRIFDLSNSNEPVLVLSARTPMSSATASGAQVPEEITLIARTNLEGELQKLFFAQTDARHLDLSPRMELIDAVDADGDGRGELLFRRTFDSGNAYAIYRVTADGLWALWQPTP